MKPLAIRSIIVITNGKIFWKHGPHCWYIRLNLKYLGWPYKEYVKTKKGSFCEELLRENDFETFLAAFCCYEYGGNSSEAVHKIVTDLKVYRRCSSYVLVCWIAKIYQLVTMKKGYLQGHLRRSWKRCRSCTKKG